MSEGIGRRIDVAIELMTRARGTQTSGEFWAHKLGSALDGKFDDAGEGHGRD
jgi:hypothetical protein